MPGTSKGKSNVERRSHENRYNIAAQKGQQLPGEGLDYERGLFGRLRAIRRPQDTSGNGPSFQCRDGPALAGS